MSPDDRWWTPAAWAARLASGNPCFPYEWAVYYRHGGVFKRVCQGTVRTSRDVPLHAIQELRVVGPGLAVSILAPPGPVRGLVLRATVVGQLGDRAACGVARWTFGFQGAGGFWGITVDPAGRVTDCRPPAAAVNGRGPAMSHVLVLALLGLALAACEQNIGSGGLAGTDRPSVVAACSQALASEPKHRDRDRDPVVVNIPRPEPTVRCSKGPAEE